MDMDDMKDTGMAKGVPAPTPPVDEGGGWSSWLPWVLFAILGAIIALAVFFNQDDDAADPGTTTTEAAAVRVVLA